MKLIDIGDPLTLSITPVNDPVGQSSLGIDEDIFERIVTMRATAENLRAEELGSNVTLKSPYRLQEDLKAFLAIERAQMEKAIP
jgi:hypothetical protein